MPPDLARGLWRVGPLAVGMTLLLLWTLGRPWPWWAAILIGGAIGAGVALTDRLWRGDPDAP